MRLLQRSHFIAANQTCLPSGGAPDLAHRAMERLPRVPRLAPGPAGLFAHDVGALADVGQRAQLREVTRQAGNVRLGCCHLLLSLNPHPILWMTPSSAEGRSRMRRLGRRPGKRVGCGGRARTICTRASQGSWHAAPLPRDASGRRAHVVLVGCAQRHAASSPSTKLSLLRTCS